ncbi:MAG: transcriptional repressor [Acidimicrobiia bacterium]|nr:transcriptional repressor [Acidimicrobiia bacterium]
MARRQLAPPSDLHLTVAKRLRGDGQRYTSNRRALVEVLELTERPLTIAEILERDPRLAQSSAYRNLSVLDSCGVVRRIVTDDEYARYELAEDLTGHHHHLICSQCGRVEDFTISPQLEASLERAFKRVTARTGFTAEHHRLDLVGSCSRCG